MRLFETLSEAESEIRRDLAKGTLIQSTRVQQRTGLNLQGRERLGYEYTIANFEEKLQRVPEIIQFGTDRGFPLYQGENKAENLHDWFTDELHARLQAIDFYETFLYGPTEKEHPALQSTIEGNYPSYTYNERLFGAMEVLTTVLRRNPDSRRAFWPIFRPDDALRSADPTRVPCSLGYQALIRNVNDVPQLQLFYLERSCDFDHFWLSDIWFARKFQLKLADRLGVLPGQLSHFIVSFHSFQVEGQEIY